MWFWIVVVVVVAAVLAWAWRHDRRRRGSTKYVHVKELDPNLANAQMQNRIHDIGGFGGGVG